MRVFNKPVTQQTFSSCNPKEGHLFENENKWYDRVMALFFKEKKKKKKNKQRKFLSFPEDFLTHKKIVKMTTENKDSGADAGVPGAPQQQKSLTRSPDTGEPRS